MGPKMILCECESDVLVQMLLMIVSKRCEINVRMVDSSDWGIFT